MAYVIAEPCIGTKGHRLCGRLSGRLHPPKKDEDGFGAVDQFVH